MVEILTTMGPWVSVLVTVGFWSYLYKDNSLFRIVEFTFVGFATAHATVLAFNSLKTQVFIPLLNRQFILFIPLILGLLFYTRYINEIRPLSRLPISIMVGVGTGLAVRAMVKTQLIDQIISTVSPSNVYTGLFMAVLTIGVISYFIFSSPKYLPATLQPFYNILTKIGRIGIMIAMGAAFGSLAVTRYTNAINLILNTVNLILGR